MHGCGDWTPERRPTLRAAPLRLGRLLRSHPKLRSTTLRVGKIGEPPGITIANLTLLDYTASGNTRFGATNPGDGQQRVTVSSGARRRAARAARCIHCHRSLVCPSTRRFHRVSREFYWFSSSFSVERPITHAHQNRRVSATKPSKTLILLVDDDIDLRSILHRFLERSGFSVVVAGNGREALVRLETQGVDLILTDLMMPEISGIELIQTVRQTNLLLPIIAMSADADLRNDRSLELAAQAGAQVVLEKPFAMNRLIREVQRLLAVPEIH